MSRDLFVKTKKELSWKRQRVEDGGDVYNTEGVQDHGGTLTVYVLV
jgi:hypothetical protein